MVGMASGGPQSRRREPRLTGTLYSVHSTLHLCLP